MQKSKAIVAGVSFMALALSGCVGTIGDSGSEDDITSIAHGGSHESAQVYDFATGTLIPGHATLDRTKDGHEVEFDAQGLTPGDVVTLWYVPFDSPENCSKGGNVAGLNACGVGDIGNVATGASMMFAGGGIVDDKGELVMEDYVGLGVDGAPGEIFKGDGLDNITGSEVHLVPRTHGPPIDSCFEEQITTFGGCCDLPGVACANLQVAVFAP